MEKKEIEKNVIDLIVDYFNGLSTVIRTNPEDLKMDSTFDDIGADSLDKVFVIKEIEKFFGISISEEEIESLETIGDMVDLVEKYVN